LGFAKSLSPNSNPARFSNSPAHNQVGLDSLAERRVPMQAKSLLFQRFGEMHKSPLFRTKTKMLLGPVGMGAILRRF
jgi:hypothetical protein